MITEIVSTRYEIAPWDYTREQIENLAADFILLEPSEDVSVEEVIAYLQTMGVRDPYPYIDTIKMMIDAVAGGYYE